VRADREKKDEKVLQEVEMMMLAGIASGKIQTKIAKDRNVTQRTVKRYMKEVRDKWGSNPSMTMWMNTYRKALHDGRYAAAVSAMDRMRNLHDPDEEIAKFESLEVVPADTLARVEWAQHVASMAMRDAMLDRTLSPAERRDEIRRTGRVIAALIPDTRLYVAEKSVRDDANLLLNDRLEEGLEDASQRTTIPLRPKGRRERPGR
jgi:hypothetical protein